MAQLRDQGERMGAGQVAPGDAIGPREWRRGMAYFLFSCRRATGWRQEDVVERVAAPAPRGLGVPLSINTLARYENPVEMAKMAGWDGGRVEALLRVYHTTWGEMERFIWERARQVAALGGGAAREPARALARPGGMAPLNAEEEALLALRRDLPPALQTLLTAQARLLVAQAPALRGAAPDDATQAPAAPQGIPDETGLSEDDRPTIVTAALRRPGQRASGATRQHAAPPMSS